MSSRTSRATTFLSVKIKHPGGKGHLARQDVFRREACHVDGVLRRRERRRVRQLQRFEVVDRAAQPDRDGDGVDALVHGFAADNLSAEYLLAVRREDQLEIHRHGARVIRRVGVLRDDDRLIIPAFDKAFLNKRFFVCAGAGAAKSNTLAMEVPAFPRNARYLPQYCRRDPSLLVGGPASGIIVRLLSIKSSTSITSPTA